MTIGRHLYDWRVLYNSRVSHTWPCSVVSVSRGLVNGDTRGTSWPSDHRSSNIHGVLQRFAEFSGTVVDGAFTPRVRAHEEQSHRREQRSFEEFGVAVAFKTNLQEAKRQEVSDYLFKVQCVVWRPWIFELRLELLASRKNALGFGVDAEGDTCRAQGFELALRLPRVSSLPCTCLGFRACLALA